MGDLSLSSPWGGSAPTPTGVYCPGMNSERHLGTVVLAALYDIHSLSAPSYPELCP